MHASSGHFQQIAESGGYISYARESKGTVTSWRAFNDNTGILIHDYWPGDTWSIYGTHPGAGTAWMHCHT